jgi:hypothetical protein
MLGRTGGSMGAITNLIRTAGDFFNSTEEEQFMSSRKGIIYKKNTTKDWHPYEDDLRLEENHYSFRHEVENDDDDEPTNEIERYFIAKGKNIRRRPRMTALDIDSDYSATRNPQAHVSYMIDDDGSVVKM